MKHIKFNKTVIAAVLVCLSLLLFSCQKDNPEKPTSKINYHFASLSEGKQLLAANDEYYNNMMARNTKRQNSLPASTTPCATIGNNHS